MEKQKEGVFESIIVCAKKEFLEKGYMEASLRTIATNANTTTGYIYTRFGDKKGLLRAIVEPVVNEMKNNFLLIEEQFTNKKAVEQECEMVNYSK